MYLVGKRGKKGEDWGVCGIFSTRKKAERHAKSGTTQRFIGPIKIDKPLPERTEEWPRGYWIYPEFQPPIFTRGKGK